MKKFRRKIKGKMLGGVCAGIAEYFNVDVSLVRLAMVLLALIDGLGIVFYILAWIVVPAEESEGEKAEEIGTEVQSDESDRSARIVAGIFLIALGVYFLIRNYFGLFLAWDKIWPILLIILGVWIIYRGVSKKEEAGK